MEQKEIKKDCRKMRPEKSGRRIAGHQRTDGRARRNRHGTCEELRIRMLFVGNQQHRPKGNNL